MHSRISKLPGLILIKDYIAIGKEYRDERGTRCIRESCRIPEFLIFREMQNPTINIEMGETPERHANIQDSWILIEKEMQRLANHIQMRGRPDGSANIGNLSINIH